MGRHGKGEDRMWEQEMLGEYLAQHHPAARVMTRVRLGPLGSSVPYPNLTPEEKKLLGAAFRRWADALVVDQGQLLVVETAMLPDPRDISIVQVYLELIPLTPELHELRTFPRAGRLVWAVDDPFSRSVATRAGLEVVIFRPSNWPEWLRVTRAREHRGARTLLPAREAF